MFLKLSVFSYYTHQEQAHKKNICLEEEWFYFLELIRLFFF